MTKVELQDKVNALEEEIKNLKNAQDQLEKYSRFEDAADDVATQLAINRDALMNKGFTSDQAFQVIMGMINNTTFGR